MMRLALALAFSLWGAGIAQLPQKPERGPDQLWIGHFLVPIEDFISVTPANDAGRGGRYIVLLLDDITTPIDQVPRVRDVARHVVSRLEPDDHMAIVTLNGSAMESTGDRA